MPGRCRTFNALFGDLCAAVDVDRPGGGQNVLVVAFTAISPLGEPAWSRNSAGVGRGRGVRVERRRDAVVAARVVRVERRRRAALTSCTTARGPESSSRTSLAKSAVGAATSTRLLLTPTMTWSGSLAVEDVVRVLVAGCTGSPVDALSDSGSCRRRRSRLAHSCSTSADRSVVVDVDRPPTIDRGARREVGVRAEAEVAGDVHARGAADVVVQRLVARVAGVAGVAGSSRTGLFSGCVIVGVTVTGRARASCVTSAAARPARGCAQYRSKSTVQTRVACETSVPPQTTCAVAVGELRAGRRRGAVEQLVLVRFGRMSGSRALFVGRFSTAITLLMPASASENAHLPRVASGLDCGASSRSSRRSQSCPAIARHAW